MGYVITGMGDCLGSAPAIVWVGVEISPCRLAFIISSATFVSLMSVQLVHVD